MGSISRRGLLCGLLGSAGCLERSDSPEAPAPDFAAPADLPAREVSATLAHWFEPAAEPVGNTIRATLPPSVEATFEVSSSRRAHEAAVAERLNAASPPDSFQSVLGAELRRYVDAVTVHEIPELQDGELRTGVDSMIEFDGDPFAVPVTLDRANGVFIHQQPFAEIGIDPREISQPVELIEALLAIEADTELDGFVLPERGASLFWTFCLLVAGESGIASYDGLRERDIPAVDLRSAVERLARVLEVCTLVEDREIAATRFETEEAAMMLASAPAALRLSEIDPQSIPFPGTASQFHLHATGWTFPKRANSPDGTVALLSGLNEPDCQAAIARATHTVPAKLESTIPAEASAYAQSVADHHASTGTIRAAINSGCGIDPDLRRRAIWALEDAELTRETTDALGDQLLELFR